MCKIGGPVEGKCKPIRDTFTGSLRIRRKTFGKIALMVGLRVGESGENMDATARIDFPVFSYSVPVTANADFCLSMAMRALEMSTQALLVDSLNASFKDYDLVVFKCISCDLEVPVLYNRLNKEGREWTCPSCQITHRQ